jgi:hypothetical protein
MRSRTKVLARFVTMVAALTVMLPAAPASAAPVILHASLSGPAEVPGPGDADATGAAEVKINVQKRSVCFAIVVKDVALPATAAHIHVGAADVAGDIVVTLAPPAEIADSGFGLAKGCARDQSRAALRAIRNAPADYYVNVHNEEFPGGALRGQLQTHAAH